MNGGGERGIDIANEGENSRSIRGSRGIRDGAKSKRDHPPDKEGPWEGKFAK